jgi:PfaD family protein
MEPLYVMTGSVNQACVESGSSDIARQMLAEAEQADVIMAPAADMFEMGVKVQVLKRGTMFAMRGAKLYDFYRKYGAIEQIPRTEREMLEEKFFKNSLENVWQQTHDYFQERAPVQINARRVIPSIKWH